MAALALATLVVTAVTAMFPQLTAHLCIGLAVAVVVHKLEVEVPQLVETEVLAGAEVAAYTPEMAPQ